MRVMRLNDALLKRFARLLHVQNDATLPELCLLAHVRFKHVIHNWGGHGEDRPDRGRRSYKQHEEEGHAANFFSDAGSEI
ncbi:hypothetical protein MACH17_26660 [Phaeobacter inhibens]|nr:hypothetical protein MACH17_26660 [Phaeobacter inhibens]